MNEVIILENRMNELSEQMNHIAEFRKLFRKLEIEMPVAIKKKLESKENKNIIEIDELWLKHERLTTILKEKIENE